jgi:hypothetical protein
MNTANMNEADQLLRYSRRSLWTVLVFFLLIGAGATAAIGFPGSQAAVFASKFSLMFPILIVIALAALKSSAKGARTDPSGPAMKALLNDELRQASMHRAYRNAFFAMLAVQPLLAVAPSWIAFANPSALMACLTVLAGVVTMVASLLYYDR